MSEATDLPRCFRGESTRSQESSLKGRIAKYYDDEHRHRERSHPEWMSRIYYSRFRGMVLEVGCGKLATPYPEYVGVDISREALRELAQGRVQCVLADGENLPFRDGGFDTVCSHDLLPHDPNPEILLSEMVRVSASQILIVSPNYVHGKRFARDLGLGEWIGLVYTWRKSRDERPARLQHPLVYSSQCGKDAAAVSAINLRFVEEILERLGARVEISTSFMYDWAGIVKGGFLRRFLIGLPLLKYLGPMMCVVARKQR